VSLNLKNIISILFILQGQSFLKYNPCSYCLVDFWRNTMKLQLSFLLLIISLSVPAQITTDGSLGPQLNLPGPDYQIGPNLGQPRGGNLFHSFQDFNLQSWESATFSGPNHIQNVISRVTGGNPSNIDGLFRSTIPGADVYFLNPYGIMFGPNAQLDVQGSFHASTADYLRLGKNGRFDALHPNDSLLTVAPVEAFGFLDNMVASILVVGDGQEINQSDWNGKPTGLNVQNDQTLSLIGGHIEISEGNYVSNTSMFAFSPFKPTGSLGAPGGRINLASVASQGEIILSSSDLDISQFNQLGDIRISTKSLIDVSGNTLGQLFIRGKRLFVHDNSFIQAEMFEGGEPILAEDKQNPISIDIKVQDLSLLDASRIFNTTRSIANAGDISIQADKIALTNRSRLGSNTLSTGNAGNVLIQSHHISISNGGIFSVSSSKGNSGHISIQTNDLIMKDRGRIGTDTISTGRGGNVSIQTNNIALEEGGRISSATLGDGNAGQIHIHANDQIVITGVRKQTDIALGGFASGIISSTEPAFSGGEMDHTVGGSGGNILLEGKELILAQGGLIASSSIASEGKKSGPAGNITLHISGTIKLSGINPSGENSDGLGSGIYANAKGDNSGKAGNIFIVAESLLINEGAVISSATHGHSLGGDIHLQINGTLTISGDSSDIVLNEPAKAQLDFLEIFPDIQTNFSASGIYSSSESVAPSAGQAGHIIIQAQNLNVTQGALINSSTQNAGGGSISLITPGLLYLRQSEMTTSVHGGSGDGGNIEIANPQFTVLNQGQITAQADAGHGGNIRIVAEQFIKSYESLISASSRLGLDGNVQIDSPTVDLDAMLVMLPGGYVEAQLKKCNIEEELENPNTFTVKKRYLPTPLMK
jgi:filamentous hemagglutinin family protein